MTTYGSLLEVVIENRGSRCYYHKKIGLNGKEAFTWPIRIESTKQ